MSSRLWQEFCGVWNDEETRKPIVIALVSSNKMVCQRRSTGRNFKFVYNWHYNKLCKQLQLATVQFMFSFNEIICLLLIATVNTRNLLLRTPKNHLSSQKCVSEDWLKTDIQRITNRSNIYWKAIHKSDRKKNKYLKKKYFDRNAQSISTSIYETKIRIMKACIEGTMRNIWTNSSLKNPCRVNE